jgi:uncharacterized protein (TIGR03437 family)
VTKLSADGKTLLYSTFVGLPVGNQYSCCNNPEPLSGGLAIDAEGNAFVTGGTTGGNFPQVGGTQASSAGGTDAFLLKLDTNGILRASVLFGGSGNDVGTSIARGPDGLLYLAGTTESKDFPVTSEAYRSTPQSAHDLFFMRIDPARLAGNQFSPGVVLNSTYLIPGSSPLVAVDGIGNAYVAASTTTSLRAPTPGPVPAECASNPCTDLVLLKLMGSGNKLLYTTYFGGDGSEVPGGLAVDDEGSAYVSGTTYSTDFPATKGALKTSWNPSGRVALQHTAFVAKWNPDASLAYATYMIGSDADTALGITLDAAGNAYVAGATGSTDFPPFPPSDPMPVVDGVQAGRYFSDCYSYSNSGLTPTGRYFCGTAGFLMALNPTGTALVWSTALGSGEAYASVLDSAANIYVTGQFIDPSQGPTAYGSPSNSVSVVKLSPQTTPLQFSENSITNSASFHPGLPLPGGLASLFVRGVNVAGTVTGTGVPLPIELAGVSILVDGKPAPILGVAALSNSPDMQQVNFQVPFEAKSNRVEVRYAGASEFAQPFTGAPGIFLLPDGSPAIQHASDYSQVTADHPAAKGETIIVYVTGLGVVTPAGVTGMPANGAAAVPGNICRFSDIGSVLYAGLVPGFVGLYQMNIQLSPNLLSGTIQFQLHSAQCGTGVQQENSASNTVALPIE